MNAHPDFNLFFERYAQLYTQALSDAPDYEAIAACFSSCFIAAGPQGVQCGVNDEHFLETLKGGYAFYKKIGTKQMRVRRTLETQIDAAHYLVKVFYHADYKKADGAAVAIEFDVTYLIDTHEDTPKIFAFIAGDEMEAYRRAGLV